MCMEGGGRKQTGLSVSESVETSPRPKGCIQLLSPLCPAHLSLVSAAPFLFAGCTHTHLPPLPAP